MFKTYNNKISSTNKMLLYFPELPGIVSQSKFLNIFLHEESGQPYDFDPKSGSVCIKVPARSIWIIGGRHQILKESATDDIFEIEIAKIDIQNRAYLTKRPKCYEAADNNGCFINTGNKKYIYVAGGVFITEATTYQCLNTVRRIDVDNPSKWEIVNPLPEPRALHSLASYKQTHIYVFGGYTFNDNISSPDKLASINQNIIRLNVNSGNWEKINYTSQIDDFSSSILNKMGTFHLPGTNELILFGGLDNLDELSAKIFCLSLDCEKRELINKTYLPREEVFKDKNEVISGNQLILFSSKEPQNLLVYDISKNEWVLQSI